MNRSRSSGWGYKLIPFARMDSGIQTFDQETADETYASYILGGTGGMQGHMTAPGGVMFSPFLSATALRAMSSSAAVGDNAILWLSYGFDLIFRGFSLSGIVQPFMGPAGIYTLSVGFGF